MASENEDRETLADVVAEIRAYGAQPPPRLMWLDIADRIEAAAKRDEERAVEHATRHAEAVARDNCRDCVYNPKGKNFEGGNAAALREAMEGMCKASQDVFRSFARETFDGERRLDSLGVAFDKAKEALSAPARNCDRFMSIDQARTAYCSECGRIISIWDGIESWLFEEWLLAPAAERKGEGDGR